MADRTPYVYRALTSHPEVSVPTLSHRELMGRRLVVNGSVRFLVALLLAVGAAAGVISGLLEPRRATLIAALGVGLALYNAVFYAYARRFQDPSASAKAFPRLRLVMFAAILVDYLVLAAIVALFGGVRSPVTAFYLLHVVLGCLMLARRVAIGFTALAFALIAAQAALEITGWAPASALMGASRPPLSLGTALAILGVYGALFALTDVLLISLVEWLRRSERELRDTNARLDRLSRLRRDFLHIAVHNLRAPVGASQMLVENLAAGLAGPLNERQQDWVLRVGQRLGGLQEMLQDLRTLGELETKDVEATSESVDLEELVREVAREYGDEAEAVGVSLVVETDGRPPRSRGIPRLLREALVNYVSNALKYAPGSGPVVLAVRPSGSVPEPSVRVEVRDRGPGIPATFTGRLFEEFGTPPSAPGEPERPRGSGLGLSIVRRVAEAHGGRVGVESEEGRGSTFWLELPGE